MASLTRSKLALWIARHVVPTGLAAIGVLLILGYLFVFRVQLASIRAADRVALLQTEYQAKQDYLNKLDLLEKQYASFQPEDVARIRQIIPKDDDTPGILAMLDASAVAADVQLTSVNFGAGDIEGLPPVTGLSTINVAIALQHADYERFKLFLESLESNLRLFDVRNVNLDVQNATYTLTIRTYVWSRPAA